MSEARRPTFLRDVGTLPRPSGPVAKRYPAWTAAPLDPALAVPPPSPPTVQTAPAPNPPAPAPPSAFEPLPQPSAPPPPIVIDHTPRLGAAIEGLRQEGRRLAEQARSDALEIGVLIARKIVERELSASLDPLFQLIRSAVRRDAESRPVVVKVSPEAHRRLPDSPGAQLSLVNVTVVADESLSAGDVVVESDQHGVDARLDTRLEELRRELKDLVQHE